MTRLESIRSEQKWHWDNQRRLLVESFLESHPDFAADESSVLDAIYGEFVMREEFGERPPPDEYYRRFPELQDKLARQFQIHRLFGELGVGTAADESAVTPGGPKSTANVAVPGYILGPVIGSGGRCTVYRARQKSLPRHVALKLVRVDSPAGREHLRREAEILSRISHPNIIKIYDYGEHGDRCFIAMELASQTLEERLENGPLPAPEAAALVEQLARGLAAAHVLGIVHRDVKPANVMLMEDGVPKLVDFGLALRPAKRRNEGGGTLVGTVAYMAPEQADPGGKVGPAADIYALGLLLHEALTGRRLIPESDPAKALRAIARCRAVPLPASICPYDLDTIRMKCLQPRPEDRYPSALDVAEDLLRFRESERPKADRTAFFARLWRRFKP